MLDPIDNSTPVLLLCARTPVGAIGAARSLGRLGVCVYVADMDHSGPASWSRYCRKSFDWKLLNAPEEESLNRLLEIGVLIGRRSLIVPTFDDAAILIASNRDRLSEHFICPRQAGDMVHSLVDKQRMYYLARRIGIPTPETLFPQRRADVIEFSQRVQYPVALKAIRGARLKQKAGVTAFIVSSQAELLGLVDTYEDAVRPNLMLQEYIPGDDSCGWGFNGYFNEASELVFGGTTLRLHQAPVHVGITSLSVIQDNPELVQLSTKFMKAVGYCGLVNVGFRFDARDETYKVVDVNPRLGASFRSFVSHDGSDILRAYYRDLTGQPVVAAQANVGRKWMLEKDLESCLSYYREGKRLGALLPAFAGVKELAYFSPADVLPSLAMVIGGVARRIRSVLHRLKSESAHKPHRNQERHTPKSRQRSSFERGV